MKINTKLPNLDLSWWTWYWSLGYWSSESWLRGSQNSHVSWEDWSGASSSWGGTYSKRLFGGG